MRSLIIPRTVRMAVLTALLVVCASLLVCASLAWLAADVSSADVAPAHVAPSAPHTAALAPPCMEDDPCWTWSRMGDRKRGIVTLSGNARVVGPCAFSRLWGAGHIRYSVTIDGKRYGGLLERMRGDAWAIVHGCDPTH